LFWGGGTAERMGEPKQKKSHFLKKKKGKLKGVFKGGDGEVRKKKRCVFPKGGKEAHAKKKEKVAIQEKAGKEGKKMGKAKTRPEEKKKEAVGGRREFSTREKKRGKKKRGNGRKGKRGWSCGNSLGDAAGKKEKKRNTNEGPPLGRGGVERNVGKAHFPSQRKKRRKKTEEGEKRERGGGQRDEKGPLLDTAIKRQKAAAS